MTRSILRAIRRRDRSYRAYRKYPTNTNLISLELLKKSIKAQINQAKTDFIDIHITRELKNGNTKPLYISGTIQPYRLFKGHTHKRHCRFFCSFFSSVFNDRSHPLPDFVLPYPPPHDMSAVKITVPGVTSLINKLDIRKASGPDQVTPYCLKEFSTNVPKFVECLALIMQASLDQSSVPRDWKEASVVPIFKSGGRDLPKNYRPISLTSVTSKMLEHIIVSNMWQHIDSFNLISNNQHGFRKRYSTTTQLLDVIHKASMALANHRTYHLISFDFAKAFDKVPHHLLLHKLRTYMFHDSVVDWIECWLLDRTSVVKVNGICSQSFNITSGVPQGSVLGPLLFILYINDMPLCVANSVCKLYADDTLLGMDITECGPETLQTNITNLYNWSIKWGMLFNPDKCIHMELGKDLPSLTLFMNGVAIPKTNCIKYLGVLIQSDLKWHGHIQNIVNKSNATLFMMMRCLFNASIQTKMLAFTTVVRPILEYASQVWSPHTKLLVDKLETIQRRAVRWVFRLGQMDGVSECMKSNEIETLAVRREDLDFKFLKRIEFGLYDLVLDEYISFNQFYQTRHGTVNPHFGNDQFKFSFFNRVRSKASSINLSDSFKEGVSVPLQGGSRRIPADS